MVVDALESLAPLSGAASWDNVGLLVEPVPEASVGRVLLCIDLSESVMDEALSDGAELVVAYHPPIFTGARRLTQAVPLQRSILRAVRGGIAIHSPHTALDAAAGGVCDWLSSGLGPLASSRPIEPLSPPLDSNLGGGRLVTLAEPASLGTLTGRIKRHLGLTHLRSASHPRHEGDQATVRSVAVCPGSGGGLFEGVASADLFVTGEMQHHDVLARVAMGSAVVLTDHSNSERGYLPILRERLADALGPGVEVRVSTADAEPLRVV
jgi:dinuclear metal center YbgI/SA1388 family protein